MAGELIARMISEAKNNVPSDSTDLIFGQVTSVSPLVVYVDSKYYIEEDLLVLMAPVKRKTISFTVNDISNSSSTSIPYVTSSTFGEPGDSNSKSSASALSGTSHSHSPRVIEIEIFRDLKVGDKVYMIKGQKNQIYYVLDRR